MRVDVKTVSMITEPLTVAFYRIGVEYSAEFGFRYFGGNTTCQSIVPNSICTFLCMICDSNVRTNRFLIRVVDIPHFSGSFKRFAYNTDSSPRMSFSGGKVPVGRGSHASFGMQLSRRCCWLVASLWAAFSLVGIVASDPSTSSTHNQDQSPNNANAQLRGKRNKHQRSLARFGFSSAFEDSLYTSQEPTREAPCPPQRLHVSQASNVDGADLVNMTVSFTLPYHMCRNVQTAVSYGRGVLPDGTVEDSEVLQFTYNSSSGHQILTPFESDWIHHVTLSDLKAGRETYWYRIMVYTWDTNAFPDQSTASRQPYNAHALAVSPEQDILWARKRKVTSLLVGESKVQVLMTPPLLHQPTSLALVGDLGQTENSTKTMHHIFRATRPLDGSIPVSGLILAGDLSYADGDPRRWPSWLDLMVRAR